MSYTYDAAGNLATMASSNTNGVSVAYTWDDLNRLSTVVDNRLPAGQNTTRYMYDPASNLATVTYPNGLSSTFVYDDLNRLKSRSRLVRNQKVNLRGRYVVDCRIYTVDTHRDPTQRLGNGRTGSLSR